MKSTANDSQHPQPRLTHHRLRVFWEAVALVRLVHQHPIADAELRDQAKRASRSTALNISEGAALDGAMAKKHFRISRGSAIETVGAYDLAHDALGETVPVELVRAQGAIVVAMLTNLLRR